MTNYKRVRNSTATRYAELWVNETRIIWTQEEIILNRSVSTICISMFHSFQVMLIFGYIAANSLLLEMYSCIFVELPSWTLLSWRTLNILHNSKGMAKARKSGSIKEYSGRRNLKITFIQHNESCGISMHQISRVHHVIFLALHALIYDALLIYSFSNEH